ncbi:sensor histidine kinase [candidate division KSB1 bacterium]
MAKKQIESELSVLKAQINPHFLLNTFNSLYSLSLKNSPEIPEIILKYSDMMKYILTKVSSDRVELDQELYFINNYISIQKLRFSDKCDITFSVEGKTGGKLIAPMVLFPFVENSFKHGIGTSNSDSFIKISLNAEESTLRLAVVNSIPKNLINNDEASLKTGLINVEKRLKITYDSKYDLTIQKTEEIYSVQLEIEL